ncbi:hypothetical protein TTRE_0000077901 [Trichuris trichiura]|uniref:Uncharacterized protein n=1 Tax=Trichuris trichiura TaxID=36087 RepID=A0A077YWU7_TRITR|nr:hypothetical protein TTRE_0000077901 [Trichuris trichiura]
MTSTCDQVFKAVYNPYDLAFCPCTTKPGVRRLCGRSSSACVVVMSLRLAAYWLTEEATTRRTANATTGETAA